MKKILITIFLFLLICFFTAATWAQEEATADETAAVTIEDTVESDSDGGEINLNNRLSIGIDFGVADQMFGTNGFFRDQVATHYELIHGAGYAGWNGDTDVADTNSNVYGSMTEDTSGPFGFHIGLDIKFRFLSYLYAGLGLRATPILAGSITEFNYYVDASVGDNSTAINVKSSISGFKMVIPIQVGIYLPTGFGGGVHIGAGPGLFYGKFKWQMEIDSSPTNITNLFNGDTLGELEFSDFGLGMCITMGYEQAIGDTGLMLFANIGIDIYYPTSVEAGTITGGYDPATGSLASGTANSDVDLLMVQEFDRLNARFSYFSDGMGSSDLIPRWALKMSDWQFLIGVQYLLPEFF